MDEETLQALMQLLGVQGKITPQEFAQLQEVNNLAATKGLRARQGAPKNPLMKMLRQRGRAAPPGSGKTIYGGYTPDPTTDLASLGAPEVSDIPVARKVVSAKVLPEIEGEVVNPAKQALRGARAARMNALKGGAEKAAAGGAASLLSGLSWPLALAFILPSLIGTGADLWKTSQQIDLAKKQMGNESLANALLVQQGANREERDREEAVADKERQRSMLREMMRRQGSENQANRIMALLGQGANDRGNIAASGMAPAYQDIAMLSGQGKPSVWESLGIE